MVRVKLQEPLHFDIVDCNYCNRCHTLEVPPYIWLAVSGHRGFIGKCFGRVVEVVFQIYIFLSGASTSWHTRVPLACPNV